MKGILQTCAESVTAICFQARWKIHPSHKAILYVVNQMCKCEMYTIPAFHLWDIHSSLAVLFATNW
jgi:hypothetical protein